jgi:hypothetical protein
MGHESDDQPRTLTACGEDDLPSRRRKWPACDSQKIEDSNCRNSVVRAFGPQRSRGEAHGHAKALIAIGDQATGVLAIGGLAQGIVAVGGLSEGLIAVGGCTLGLLAAFGGVAVGGFAMGGVAIGAVARGGVAIGGLSAEGREAVSPYT